MALSSKYCSSCSGNSTTYSSSSCCSSSIQTAPSACCESHDTVVKWGMCLYPTCDIVATSGTFYLTFTNSCYNEIPINANDVFFYSESAGLMQVKSFDNVSYGVQLVDSSKAGMIIRKGSCVLVTVQQTASTIPTGTRCLEGNFVVPAIGADGEIYILNGSGIPIGATITFTSNGETGSYTVKAFVSAANNIYVYTVTNTGNGHTAGTIIDGGCTGACTVAIEVITDVDICDLSETETADTITVCLNGSPRALVSAGEDYALVGDSDGGFTQRKLLDVDCCIIIDDCLKFSGNVCPDGTDSVVIRDINLDCFEAAWAEAQAADQNLPMNINGYNVVITAYDSGTRTITVAPADPDPLAAPISYSAGDQLCLGECCEGCLIGEQHTNHQIIDIENPANDSVIGIFYGSGELVVPAGVSYWLIGFDYVTGNAAIQAVDAAYIATGAGAGPGFPRITDPLFIKQKICNTSPTGCDQLGTVQFNYILNYWDMPASMVIDWELGHFAQGSQFLEDGVTPNPFFNISTQQKASGTLIGPSASETPLLDQTSFSTGTSGFVKYFPFAAGDFRDYIILRKCDCAMSIVWWFMRVNNGEVGEVNLSCSCTVRRQLEKKNWNLISNPLNSPNSDDFNT